MTPIPYPRKYKLKIQVFNEQPDFGPGVATILSLVKETHSLRQACAAINMSYSKGWKIIGRAEQDLGFSLLEGTAGGSQGGGSHLTPEAEEMLERYNSFMAEARGSVDALFRKYFT